MSSSKPSPFSPGKLAVAAGLTLAGVSKQLSNAGKGVVPRNAGKNVASVASGYTGYGSSSYGNSSVALPSGFRLGSPNIGWNVPNAAAGSNVPPTKNWFTPETGTAVVPASSTPMGASASYAGTMGRIQWARERNEQNRRWLEEQKRLANAAAARNAAARNAAKAAAAAAADKKELGGGYKKHRKTRRRRMQRKTRKHRH